MNRNKNHFLCYPPLTALIVMVSALSFTLPCAHASNLWVEVHPPRIEEAVHGIELIHFIDADTGWAEAQGFLLEDVGTSLVEEIILRTSDGGQSWRQGEPPGIFHNYRGYRRRRTHFVSPTIGWKLGDDAPKREEPALMDDVEIYHSANGGVTWQLRRGKVTELVWIGETKPMPRIAIWRRLHSTHIQFIDERIGWLIGHTDVGWVGAEEFGKRDLLVWHFLYSTHDGGQTWKCQVQPFPGVVGVGLGASYRRPEDIDFVGRERGWITQRGKFMYRTTDGGMSWEGTGHPYPNWITGIHDIDFVDESRGWAIAWGDDSGVWYTSDGGQTWTEKHSAMCLAVFADMNNVWVAASHKLPTEEWVMRILHSEDDGNTWQVEWEGPHFPTYLGYHEVTQTLWAGGADGVILKRTIPTTAVTSKGKLATLWGELKAPRDSK